MQTVLACAEYNVDSSDFLQLICYTDHEKGIGADNSTQMINHGKYTFFNCYMLV